MYSKPTIFVVSRVGGIFRCLKKGGAEVARKYLAAEALDWAIRPLLLFLASSSPLEPVIATVIANRVADGAFLIIGERDRLLRLRA